MQKTKKIDVKKSINKEIKRRTALLEEKKIDMKNVKLGTRMRDTVTDFEGIAIARVEFLNGCIQYMLKPKIDKEGKSQDAIAVDSQQLIIIDDGILTPEKKIEEKKPIGGIMSDIPKM